MKMISVIVVLSATLLGEKVTTDAAQAPDNMVLIPAGEFVMGNAFNKYNPLVRTVYVSAFYMGKYEVTKSLWDEVYQWATNHGYSFDNKGVGKAVNHPVYGINWYDMVKWCNARSEKDGYEPAYYMGASQTTVYRTGRIDVQNDWVKWDAGYRLPTEAEWEKAARGGLSGKRFPWGDTISHSQANYFSAVAYSYDINPTRGFHPKFVDNSYPFTSPVGYFASNGYGLYDVQGNVWEWCWNWYVEINFDISPQNNPQGPAAGKGRVLRGGSFSSDVANGVGFRNGDGPLSMVYSQVGFRTVLSIKVPAPTKPSLNWRQAIETQPMQPTYGICPVKELEKKNIVVVTHGWQPAFLPVDIAWVADMTNVMSKYLVNQGLTEWQVHAHRWVEKAHTGTVKDAINNAKPEGESLGKYIIDKGFTKVHLVGHSAAGKLLQAACETVKALKPEVTVHLTFLDPFVGFDYAGVKDYGKGADWAENYFSRDALTSPINHRYTEGPLENAYNVDVTFLDTKNRVATETFRSSKNEALEHCFETRTSHGWPIEFYLGTIPPSMLSDTRSFGFLLSEEVGGLAGAMAKYGKRGNIPEILGTPDLECPVGNLYVTTPSFVGEKMEFKDTSSTKSTTGTIKLDGLGFTLVTGSPVWIASSVFVTNRVNFISFESRFLNGNGSEGLLSVYSNTNLLGTIDERVTPAGVQTNRFVLPETITQGTGVLGFRLDAFSGTSSSVTITNVALGFAGLNQPFSLSATGAYESGRPVFQLTGPTGYNYSVETSSDLVLWTPLALLVNTNGTVRFIDSRSNNATTRFYRAVAP